MDYAKQIAEIIAKARPGARVIYIEIPPDLGTPNEEHAPASAQDEAIARIPTTDLGTASALAPTHALKVTEWAGILPGVSARELERAIEAKAIPAQEKGDGRDWAALVITGQAMVNYLAECETVQLGKRQQPEWWQAVRKGENALIRKAA